MRRRVWLWKLLVVSLVPAVSPLAAQQKAAPESVRAAVGKTLALWVAAANRGDAAGVAALYTPDGMLLPPGAAPVVGRAAIEQTFRQTLPILRDPRFLTEEVESAGALAVERGRYERTLAVPGKAVVRDTGKYLIVWKRGGDGAWRLHRGTLISDLPAPPARAAAGDSVFAIVNHVKPEARAEWERMAQSLFVAGWRKLGETNPAYARAAQNVRVLASGAPEADGSYTYLVLVDPHATGVSYDGRDALAALHAPDEIQELVRAYMETLARPQETRWLIQK